MTSTESAQRASKQVESQSKNEFENEKELTKGILEGEICLFKSGTMFACFTVAKICASI